MVGKVLKKVLFGGFGDKIGQKPAAAAGAAGGAAGLSGLAGLLMQRNMMQELFGNMSLAPPPVPQSASPGGQAGPQGGGLGVPAPQAPMGPGAQQRPPIGGPLQKPTPQGLGALMGGSGAPPMGVNPAQMGNHQTSLTPPPDGRRSIDQIAQEEFGEFELPPETPPEDPMAGVAPDPERQSKIQDLEQEMEYWSSQPDSEEKAAALEAIRQSMEQLRSD